jgi:hypothetical protein
MDTVTYPDPHVVAFVEQYCVPVRIQVKEHKTLARDFLVSWTPNLVLVDDRNRVHHRLEGYFDPLACLAQLSIGVGKFRLNDARYIEAAERFAAVSARHQDTESGAEALYWLGVSRYRETHDKAVLAAEWKRLATTHSLSPWAERTRLPPIPAAPMEKPHA